MQGFYCITQRYIMLSNINNTPISTKALRAAKEALANAIEGTATLAGLSGSFRKNLSGKRLQGQKLSLSLPLLTINNSIYLFCRESIFTKEIDISLAYWVRAAKVGANIRQIMLFVVSALSARYFSFKML